MNLYIKTIRTKNRFKRETFESKLILFDAIFTKRVHNARSYNTSMVHRAVCLMNNTLWN
jgi:hypothetical protein